MLELQLISFMKQVKHWHLNLEGRIIKDNYRLKSLMNVETQILSKISPNVIHCYSKKTMHHDLLEFIPEAQDWFSDKKSINITGHINRFKGKNYMVIFIDARKTYQIQHPFFLKTF